MRILRKATATIVIAATLGLISWDIFVAVAGGPRSTISDITIGFFYRHPMICFAWGMINAHLTWPTKKASPILTKWWSLGGLALLLIALDLLKVVPAITPVLPMMFGFLAGHLLWSQGEDSLTPPEMS